MAARCTEGSWEEAGGITAQALAIRDRATHLARSDAEAWQRALTALRGLADRDDDSAQRDFDLERRLERAAAVPLEIAELGADVAELAAIAGERCDGAYRADTAVACALAAGGARAAAHLVAVNLAVREGDERLLRARASEEAATAAAQRALEILG